MSSKTFKYNKIGIFYLKRVVSDFNEIDCKTID